MLREKILSVLNDYSEGTIFDDTAAADAILAAINEGCEPVYLTWNGDVWKESEGHIYAVCHEEDRRILYTSPVVATGPVMHKPSGFTFDTVLACVDSGDLMALTPPAPPAVASEPVAEVMDPYCEGRKLNNVISESLPIGTELFTAPQPQQPDNRVAAQYPQHSQSACGVPQLTKQPDNRDALIVELRRQLKCMIGANDLADSEIADLQARLAAAEKDAAQLRREALDAFKSLLAWRKRSWPDTDQSEVMATSFPTIAAIAAGKESHD